MPLIGITADGKKIAAVSASGPTSYPTGGFTVRIPELTRIEQILFAFITGGFKIGGLTVSENAVTVVVHRYDYPSTSAGPSVEIPSDTNIAAQTVTIVAIGV